MNTHTHYILALWRWCVVIPGMCVVFTGFQNLFESDGILMEDILPIILMSSTKTINECACMQQHVWSTTTCAGKYEFECVCASLLYWLVFMSWDTLVVLRVCNWYMKWTECWDKLFTIYVYPWKNVHEDDFHKDPIMLWYGNRWMSLWDIYTYIIHVKIGMI